MKASYDFLSRHIYDFIHADTFKKTELSIDEVSNKINSIIFNNRKLKNKELNTVIRCSEQEGEVIEKIIKEQKHIAENKAKNPNSNQTLDSFNEELINHFLPVALKLVTKILLKINKDYQKKGTQPWSVRDMASELNYQAGTLNKSLLQLDKKVWNDNLTEEEIKRNIGMDIADIISVVLLLSHQLGLNPAEYIQKNINEDLNKINSRVVQNWSRDNEE